MKLGDIMIGNWVSHKGKPIRIFEIDDGESNINTEQDGYCGIRCISIDEIKPIPLTPEILEKNGFYFGYTTNEYDLACNTIAQLSEEEKGWVWDEGAGEVKVIFPNESDGGLVQISDQSFDRDINFTFVENIMLHELQNAIRLCKIEKEIVL